MKERGIQNIINAIQKKSPQSNSQQQRKTKELLNNLLTTRELFFTNIRNSIEENLKTPQIFNNEVEDKSSNFTIVPSHNFIVTPTRTSLVHTPLSHEEMEEEEEENELILPTEIAGNNSKYNDDHLLVKSCGETTRLHISEEKIENTLNLSTSNLSNSSLESLIIPSPLFYTQEERTEIGESKDFIVAIQESTITTNESQTSSSSYSFLKTTSTMDILHHIEQSSKSQKHTNSNYHQNQTSSPKSATTPKITTTSTTTSFIQSTTKTKNVIKENELNNIDDFENDDEFEYRRHYNAYGYERNDNSVGGGGVVQKIILKEKIIDSYFRFNEIERAEESFKLLVKKCYLVPEKPSFNLFEAFILYFANENNLQKVEEYFEILTHFYSPSVLLLMKVIRVCLHHSEIQKANDYLYHTSRKYSLKLNVKFFNSIIQQCLRLHNEHKALEYFEYMKNNYRIKPDSTTYLSFIMYYFKSDEPQKANKFLSDMKTLNVWPTSTKGFTTLFQLLKYDNNKNNNVNDSAKLKLNDNSEISDDKYVTKTIDQQQKQQQQQQQQEKEKEEEKNDLAMADIFFKKMRKLKIQPNIFIYNSILDLCAHYNDTTRMEWYLNDMKSQNIPKDAITYLILINYCADQSRGDISTAERYFKRMEEENITPSVSIFNAMINCCSNPEYITLRSPISVQQLRLHRYHRQLGESRHRRPQNISSDKSDFEFNVPPLFENTPPLSSSSSQNGDINGCSNGEDASLEDLFSEFTKDEIEDANLFRLTSQMIDSKYPSLSSSSPSSSSSYESQLQNTENDDQNNDVCILIYKAEEIFQEMQLRDIKPDLITFNSLLKVCSLSRNVDKARHFYKLLISTDDIKPDIKTFTSLIYLCYVTSDFDLADYFFEQMKLFNVRPDVTFFNSMLNSLASSKNATKLRGIFNAMLLENVLPNVITFTTLIKLFCELNEVDLADKYYETMLRFNITPNVITFSQLISCCCRTSKFELAEKYFKSMSSFSLTPNVILFNYVISSCYKSGDFYSNFTKVNELFERNQYNIQPDLITYSLLINICLRCGNIQKADYYFNLMKQNGIKPNIYIFNAYLHFCAKTVDGNYRLNPKYINKIQKAERYFQLILDHQDFGSSPSPPLSPTSTYNSNLPNDKQQSSLLDQESYRQYKENNEINLLNIIHSHNTTLKPNTITLNTMLNCCVESGNLEKAELFFSYFEKYSVLPDELSFNTVISCCVKSHNLQRAEYYFKLLLQQPHLTPSLYSLNSLALLAFQKLNFDKLKYFYLQILKFGIKPDRLTYSLMQKYYLHKKDTEKAEIFEKLSALEH